MELQELEELIPDLKVSISFRSKCAATNYWNCTVIFCIAYGPKCRGCVSDVTVGCIFKLLPKMVTLL